MRALENRARYLSVNCAHRQQETRIVGVEGKEEALLARGSCQGLGR
jgi:hypothetical protein